MESYKCKSCGDKWEYIPEDLPDHDHICPQCRMMIGVVDDWFSLNPKYRTKERLKKMLAEEFIKEL